MALSWANKDGREVRIYEYLDELSTDLADYIAELSEASVKERGVFAVALSGGSLISLMGYVSVLYFTFSIFFLFPFIYKVLNWFPKFLGKQKIM